MIKSADILTSATSSKFYPQDGKPSIAFAGRSNVGKSSLINSLLMRKSLARVSSTPGKTRTINFYIINDEFYLVDLPGYGFTKISKKDTEDFGKVMDDYFQNSTNLTHLFLLVDIRHEPKLTDKQMYDYCIHYDIPVTIVATKSDKITKGKFQKAAADIRKFLGADSSVKVFPTSSLDKSGVEELRTYMLSIV
ncbi:ribosome biogenesis GTP-binding protein YihA/YsxC [Criibacterium bergeronii]|uniref:Probable GTP-binding protein EngB n=1 Tax=Criibacterium bergeronii TaxID=1871336 RepID=A0A371IP38_9FIRM|nr:ribosome biogenesis GTP-binding protein YihA/YsxC [Criibacterium bergeronii]MBS6063393.1 ribosome biogenesis GTP-binding protein YihA/YsxC [Peptostreptococcaceae bacterium]RDY22247.1 YihA family ribosome biogenesis GTP-binding protein [Criibacterium bergeronii]TRW28742.1 YihA family ribosome biogenesis GTP-binding protein [Criibacterium bergeronii]